MNRRHFLISTAAMAATVAIAPAYAAKTNLLDGVAIQGYDPVAYFTEDKPVEGLAKFTAEHEGAVYRFASQQHLDAFLDDPARYLPQYGGFCAFAVAKGALASIDPTAFTVVDDKLYLNYSKSVRKQWQTDIPGFVDRADTNWPALSAE